MNNRKKLVAFCWRVTAAHTIAYFIAGLFAVLFLNYKEHFASESLSLFMRGFNSPWIPAGPGLQIFRGVIIGLVLYPFGKVISSPRGWLKLSALVFGLSAVSTIGPTPGSFEGFIYTTLPVKYQLFGLPETLLYTLLFSFLVYAWNKKPGKIWNVCSVCMVVLIVFFSIYGVIDVLYGLPRPS